jgi:uncharacterized protein
VNVFFSLLPIYIFGNLHCASMCGPLVMLLAKHPHRRWYFVGRLFSFTAAGMLSAEMGVVLFSFLTHYHISAAFSLFFGTWIITMGACLLFKMRLPGSAWLAKRSFKLASLLGKLMTRNAFYAVFLFGASTLLLPCGQTVIVFSLIAVNCTPLSGLLHGFLFALFTSPSLIAAMRTSQFFCKQQSGYHLWMGAAVVFVGSLAFLRGIADLGMIKHFILNPSFPSQYHLVFY